VGPRAGLDTGARGKIPSPLPGIEPRSPGRLARRQKLYCLRYPGHLKYLKNIFGPKRDEVTEEGRSCTMRSIIFCTHPQILGRSSQGE
jgi:hypothetical protein